jgi:hypothetical protein
LEFELFHKVIFQKKLFSRHGAWLTFGNIDLHLIKGRPAVHPDDDLIVSHIAITVSDMAELRVMFQKLDVASRKNVSVPNPADSDTGAVDQVFLLPKIVNQFLLRIDIIFFAFLGICARSGWILY